MALASKTVLNTVADHARTTKLFKTVNTHEPKDAPNGVHCAFYVAGIRTDPARSGANITSAVITIMGRIYLNMLSDPQDAIDPDIAAATDALFAAYNTDNTLASNAMTIDLLGMSGQALSAQAGYIDIGGTKFRSMDILIPVIVADAWTQGS